MTQFDFYLLNLSFRAPDDLDLTTLQDSIEQLSEDCEFIREHREVIYRHNSIYEEVFWEEYKVTDIIHMLELAGVIGRDYQIMLQTIIDNSRESNWAQEDLLELIQMHYEELVSGLLCLHEVEEIEEQYLIYNRNDWYVFHQYFLGLYPVSEDWFAERCSIYFPEIQFQESINTTLRTLDGGLSSFSQTIVKSLTSLNDQFNDCRITNNIPETLRVFTATCGIETTNEGDARRRNDLSFIFTNSGNENELVYCEPHMKLSSSDRNGDQKNYFNRIYFHPGKNGIAGGKILVGYIGKHL